VTAGAVVTQLQSLLPEACLELLRLGRVGRMAVVVDGFPQVVPVNYRLVQRDRELWIVVRTRPGSVIDQEASRVGFEIDGIDPIHRTGWSVLVRGVVHHDNGCLCPWREGEDPEPWMSTDRDSWLLIHVLAVTGRRLHEPDLEWAFHIRGYL
jgi:uncharacterized protein